jgi:hypothetical protein
LLKKFCAQHELDNQLIDSTLTYWENKEFLETQVPSSKEHQELRWTKYWVEPRERIVAEEPRTLYILSDYVLARSYELRWAEYLARYEPQKRAEEPLNHNHTLSGYVSAQSKGKRQHLNHSLWFIFC